MQEEDRQADDQPRTDFWRDPRPTNENPNFVRDYFASSRLHFIGSFRARYESMMVAVGKNLGVQPGQLLQSSAEKGVLSSKTKPAERVIVHVDMDCFFASIAVKKDPSLAGKCIAICHGGGEISSCSYEARKFGVHAGMFFRDARKLCPDLLSVSYDFPMYEEASIQIYSIFFDSPGVCVEAVSVDEAYLDVTLAVGDDRDGSQSGAEAFVQNLRTSIFTRTGCTASAGIGPSKLIARLATKGAKPNGQLRIRQEKVIEYLDTMKVEDLPGIGWRTTRRLSEKGVTTCPQLRALTLAELQLEFGERQGQVFCNLARALDASPVEPLKPRKSIGAEASWGVRFMKEEADKARRFIMDMADEVACRVEAAGAYGTKVVFKVYKRIPNSSMAGYKHLGHGPCTIFTRSAKLPPKTSGRSLKEILRQACLRLHKDLGVRSEELRGVGLQMTDLSFSDLNFDYTLAATAGATRRIESFFETAPPFCKSKTVPVSQKQNSAAFSGEPAAVAAGTLEGAESKHRETRTVVPDKQMSELERGSIRLQEEADIARRVTGADADGAVAVVSDSEEDRIEVGRAPGRHEVLASPGMVENAAAPPNDSNSIDIPEGWDKDVFWALPKELQAELLKERRSGISAYRSVAVNLTEPVEDPNAHIRERTKRKREANVRHTSVQAEKRKRRKQSAQVTMTQFADISELKTKGHDVLDAEEFREKPLRDCMELLEDLRGKPLNVRTIRKDGKSVRGGTAAQSHRTEVETDDEDGMDIPSPPSLSSDSDSESSYGVTDALVKQGLNHVHIYEDEDIVDYAEILKRWMAETADDIKSGHIELLRGRALELVRMKKLERLCSELGLMGMFAAQDGAGKWVKAFNVLMDEVQDECKRLYKFKLAIRQA